MITLTKRLKAAEAAKESTNNNKEDSPVSQGSSSRRVSVRDKLLVKEVQEMETCLPPGCRVKFEDPNCLHDFVLVVSPVDQPSLSGGPTTSGASETGPGGCPWVGGKFRFHVVCSEEYNMTPPTVKCLTRIWHPNINEEGDVCLSILRNSSVGNDGTGWTPARRLKDVIWGLNSLFTDLLNFDDPLNIEAAEHFQRDPSGFRLKVRDWVHKYARR